MLLAGAIPGEAQALSGIFGDKLLHLVAYSFLTLVLFGSLNGTISGRALRTLLLIGLLGAIDEGIQGLMSYRNASTTDWLFDMLAAGLTLAVLIFLARSKRPTAQTHNHRISRPVERPN